MNKEYRCLIDFNISDNPEELQSNWKINSFPFGNDAIELTVEEWDRVIEVLDRVQLFARNNRAVEKEKIRENKATLNKIIEEITGEIKDE